MRRLRDFKNYAQTAIELAVFGSILIFVIGFIVRTGLLNAYQQNHALRAMRLALKTSFEYSEGLHGNSLCGGRGGCRSGVSSHNTASVLILEDRLSADNSKYGPIDRIPVIIGGAGTHSRNLLMPIDPGEYWNLPMFDMFINGQQFPFTAAGFNNAPRADYPEKIPNHPQIAEWDPTCCTCFDLDRDGSGVVSCPGGGAADVPPAMWQYFSWQWQNRTAASIDKGDLVDVDGDLKEEGVIHAAGATLVVTDPQMADIDPTFGTADAGDPPGLQQDTRMYSYSDGGTYLEIGKVGTVLTSTQRKSTVDVIERQIYLSYNTGRFCDDNAPRATVLGTNVENPVEACSTNCFQGWNQSLTCYDLDGKPGEYDKPIIYVRSRVQDLHGRRWRTDISGDDTIDFVVP